LAENFLGGAIFIFFGAFDNLALTESFGLDFEDFFLALILDFFGMQISILL